jgi:hypothetical protein
MKPQKHVYTCPGVVELKKRGKKHTWGSRHIVSQALLLLLFFGVMVVVVMIWLGRWYVSVVSGIGGGDDVAIHRDAGIVWHCRSVVVVVVIVMVHGQ